ncbi:unnamed protein product [Rotaria sordida]|uniref:Peptidoglycan recognition protein family domain-containing protein n=1 Tax=Rotaria sordida TaxID=392033 RepID=A0A815LJ75_9BILA|nr:unnamed protein product [Rotaria sordida]
MLSSSSSNNDNDDSNIVDLLYNLCKENEVEKVQSILPCIDDINIINKIQSSTGCPNILKRSSWNARLYTNRENLTTLPVPNIVIHELEDLNSIMNQQDCITQIKELQNYDMDTQYYADIGYNFLLCGDNGDQQQIYTGRGWKFVGAHCISYNKRSLGKNEFLF